jgi:hypothetical protein
MISEVVNALLITYVGTEYLLVESCGFPQRKKKGLAILFAVVAFLNVFDRVTGAAAFLNKLLNGFLHLPKIGFAALVFVVALYFDCKKVAPTLTADSFLPLVGKAFLRVLPAYPFLAVAISFGFMIVINIFEALRIPLEYLNWPIYYGMLRG